jgi:hypothetical protein
MQIEKYALKAESSLTVFEFISEGPKGAIRKLIQFQETNEVGLFNLAFGDANETTGEIDDLAISNNGDSEKVLATVVAALYAFLINIQMLLYTPQAVHKLEPVSIEWGLLDFTRK